MDSNFRLIKLVDPTKSVVKIKDCFSKLTLSSRKKAEKPTEDQTEELQPRTPSNRSRSSRRLFDDFLTDDESESEANELNRIFRSRTTTTRTDGNETVKANSQQRESESSADQRAGYDPDETNCSVAVPVAAAVSDMERLMVSPTQEEPQQPPQRPSIEASSAREPDDQLCQLSAKLSSLDLAGKVDTEKTTSNAQNLPDEQLENIFLQQRPDVPPIKEVRTPPRFSVLTISSAQTEDDEDEDSDVIIISESSEESEADENDELVYRVSATGRSDQQSVLSGTQAERLDAFFNNIPSLDSNEGPERIFQEHEPQSSALIVTDENSIVVEENVPDESIEICETPEPSESDESPPLAKTPQRVARSPSPGPSKKTAATSFVQQLASPRRSPRKIPIVNYAALNSPSPSKLKTPPVLKNDNSANKKTPASRRAPKDVAISTSKSTTPRMATPKRLPTPKEVELSPPQDANTPEVTPEKTSTTSSEPPSSTPDMSPEIRIEKINISAKIKIRFQINDENFSASVRTSPTVSGAPKNAPQLTETESQSPTTKTTPRLTESTDAGSKPASQSERVVGTPEHLKHRSVRDPNILSFVDITKSLLAPLAVFDESLMSDVAEKENRIADSLLEAEIENPTKEEVGFQAVQLPVSPLPAALSKSPELDERAIKLLNELYGNEWKTPEVVKTLKKVKERKKQQTKPINESVVDFTRFHTNIQADLESTRLQSKLVPTASTAEPVFKLPATERKTQPKKEIAKKSQSERKIRTRGKARTPLQRPKKFYNNDDEFASDSSDIDASSDESWRDVFSDNSNSSDSDKSSIRRKKPPPPRKPKKPQKDELIYLDLSSETVKVQEVTDSPCANTDAAFQERLTEMLATCKAPEKTKIQPTNVTTKRKLFTLHLGEEDYASPPLSRQNNEFRYTINDTVKLTAPLPAIFAPINKQLEAIKTGKPIFAIKTPTTPKSSKKNNKENVPETNDEILITPKTTKKKTNKEDVINCPLGKTPANKYGFLQSLDVKINTNYCHPDAVMYRENYKTKKNELAEKLLEIYNEKVFRNDLDVPLVWNKKLLNTAGRCSCSTKKGKRQCRIELSDKVLTSADRLRCTLIHELCHAATWIFDGEHGHGETWKRWARRANQIFPELPKIGVRHDYEIDYKYTYKCTLCNAKSHAHSKSKKVENVRCYFCHGAIEVFLNKKDKDGNVLPTPVKEATGFAKFVKDNYKKHKRPDLKHADIMKLLSNEFASMKC